MLHPISKHSIVVERHARQNTAIASAAFHGTLRMASIFFLTPVSLFAGAFIVGHTHTRPGLRGESGLVSLLGEKSTV